MITETSKSCLPSEPSKNDKREASSSSTDHTATVQLFHGPGRPFEMAKVPLPENLEKGEVLVRILLATICGSDLHTFEGRRESPIPCVLGHEAVGRVEMSARDNVHSGQRVTWSLADSCGHCPACADYKLPQKCDSLFKYGHAALGSGTGLNGTYASHILLRPGTAIFEIPDELSDAVVAPANCALATITNVLTHLPKHCQSALVQGGGLLGVYACAMLRERGVKHVFCSEINESRLSLIPDFGGVPLRADARNWPKAIEQIRAMAHDGVDLVLEVAGSAKVVPEGVNILRPGGQYIWAGMVHPETHLSLTGEAVVRQCLEVRGVHNYSPDDLGSALRFLAATYKKFPYEKLVSPPFALADLDQAMALTQCREWPRVAVKI